MSDLADFLRARREQLRPGDVGLPDSGRRRTPGLRREEVATLAGVSIDYLIRLEQGRDSNPSPSVLVALGDALQLSDDERMHLYQLAAKSNSAVLCPRAEMHGDVAPTVLQLLAGLDPLPAFVLGALNDVLAANDAWSTLVAPVGLAEGANLARFVFLDPRARQVFADWDDMADEQVHQLRAVSPLWSSEATFTAFIDVLLGDDDFARRWSAHVVGAKRRGTKRLHHPLAGDLRFSHEVLEVTEERAQRVVTWLPADEATRAAIGPASPARLKVV